VGGPPARPSLK
jgi:Predicted integral membrane protein